MDRNEIFAFIGHHRLAVISTVHPSGAPQAALIGFAFSPDLGIVFDTSSRSRKAANLRAKPAAALVGWEDETTVQIEGPAHEPEGDELTRAKSVYFRAWPDGRDREALPDITYFVLHPTWMRYCCYDGEPVTMDVTLNADPASPIPPRAPRSPGAA